MTSRNRRRGIRKTKSCPPQPFDLIFQVLCSHGSSDSDFLDAERLLDMFHQEGRGVDLNAITISGMTALTQCTLDGNFASIRALIKLGANVNSKDRSGWTALHYAASEGYLDIVRFLLKSNADVTALNREAQMAVDLAEDAEIKKLLTRVTSFYAPVCPSQPNRANRMSLPVWL